MIFKKVLAIFINNKIKIMRTNTILMKDKKIQKPNK